MRAFRLSLSVVALTLLFAGGVDAEIYKYVDEHGITHLSNTPPAQHGAEVVEMSEPGEVLGDDTGVEWEAYEAETPALDEHAFEGGLAPDSIQGLTPEQLQEMEAQFSNLEGFMAGGEGDGQAGGNPILLDAMAALGTIAAMGIAAVVGITVLIVLLAAVFSALILKLACKVGGPEVPSFKRAYGIIMLQSLSGIGVVGLVVLLWPLMVVQEGVEGPAAWMLAMQSPTLQALTSLLPLVINVAILSKFLGVGPVRGLWIYILWTVFLTAIMMAFVLGAVLIGVGGAALSGG